jgi:hypothetical protein
MVNWMKEFVTEFEADIRLPKPTAMIVEPSPRKPAVSRRRRRVADEDLIALDNTGKAAIPLAQRTCAPCACPRFLLTLFLPSVSGSHSLASSGSLCTLCHTHTHIHTHTHTHTCIHARTHHTQHTHSHTTITQPASFVLLVCVDSPQMSLRLACVQWMWRKCPRRRRRRRKRKRRMTKFLRPSCISCRCWTERNLANCV